MIQKPRITFFLSPAQREALDDFAVRNDLTMSQVVRRALARLLAEDDQQRTPTPQG